MKKYRLSIFLLIAISAGIIGNHYSYTVSRELRFSSELVTVNNINLEIYVKGRFKKVDGGFQNGNPYSMWLRATHLDGTKLHEMQGDVNVGNCGKSSKLVKVNKTDKRDNVTFISYMEKELNFEHSPLCINGAVTIVVGSSFETIEIDVELTPSYFEEKITFWDSFVSV